MFLYFSHWSFLLLSKKETIIAGDLAWIDIVGASLLSYIYLNFLAVLINASSSLWVAIASDDVARNV